MTTNLTARIDTVEVSSDGLRVVWLPVRGGRGNPVVETWTVATTDGKGLQAERRDRQGELIEDMDGFRSTTEVLRWLTEQAWHAHNPDSITVYPVRVARALVS